MRVLITGSRAPVALDLARRFHRCGHVVMQADSLKHGIGKWSNSAAKSFSVPRPSDGPRRYAESLATIVDDQQIDWLIPTCEEVFFIAAHRTLLNCEVLVDEFDKLAQIHNKWSFSQLPGNDFASPPETILLERTVAGESGADRSLPPGELPSNWVFKPVFSRFASRTLIGPTVAQLQQLEANLDEPWIAQRRIRGTEYSTYSIAYAGELRAHITYHSLYRAGLGSGILVEPIHFQVVEDYVAAFVKSHCFTGQIGFDLMRDDAGRFWVLEANPRATTGAQIFANCDPLADVLMNRTNQLLRSTTTRPVMIEFAMPFWGLWDAIRNGRCRHYIPDVIRSRSTTLSWRDPWPTLALLPALIELGAIALKEGRTLQQASTFDIEWNGGPM